eukprot:jgi/Botrbrau1/14961/Bobra.0018s0064.1
MHIPRVTSRKQPAWLLGKETEDVSNKFNLGRVLGKGQFGTTRLAEEKSTGKEYACKSISKRKLTTAEDIADVQREVQIMHHLRGHDNVVQLKEVFEDKNNVHLVMELAAGGELFDHIVARGHYTEKDAAHYDSNHRQGRGSLPLHGCHSSGFEAGELSALRQDKQGGAEGHGLRPVRVCQAWGKCSQTSWGSAYYVAPEVLRRHYGKEADIWSCGIILYILLSGVPPFWGETESQIFDAILKGKVDFETDPWPQISKEAKDCVRQMLQQDVTKRASANDILKHSWMRENGTASDKPLDNAILNRMRGFAGMNKLKKEALKVIATTLSPEEIAGLRSMFQALDKDNSGTITLEELQEGMKEQGSQVATKEMQALLKSIDIDASGTIAYDEFLAATIHQCQLEKDDVMLRAFQSFDTDNSGYITTDELEAALKGQAGSTAEEIKKILQEVDKDGDGRIDYEEFCAMMRKDAQEAAKKIPAKIRKGAIL